MPNLGVSPVDFSTDIGIVRALLGDTDAENVTSGVGEFAWFGDNEIEAVLGVYGDSPKRAAARLLLTVAASQALLLKKWSADDLSVDGAAIAEALRKQAATLMDEADKSDNGVDIFELSYPGRNREFIPEVGPLPAGARWGKTVVSAPPQTIGETAPPASLDDDPFVTFESGL